MGFLLLFLTGPLLLFFALLTNWSSHYLQRQTEQQQLDAWALSLCKKRVLYFNEIEQMNSKIKQIQRMMDLEALACFTAIPVLCAGSTALIRMQSTIAQFISTKQDLQRIVAYGKHESQSIQLQKNNQLTSNYGHLIIEKNFSPYDGLQRENLSAPQKSYEIFFGVKWPRALEASSALSQHNTLTAQFNPRRSLLIAQSNSQLKLRTKISSSTLSTSRTGCRIQPQSKIPISVNLVRTQ